MLTAKKQPQKPACYLRCSSRTQDTDAQRGAIQKYLDGNGIWVPPDRWYLDDAVTGATIQRPALDALKQAIFNGEVDCVIVYDVARFARTFIDGLTELDRWQQMGVRLVFVSQGIEINPAEWTGQVVLKILVAITLAFAEAERERIRSRMQAGIDTAKEKTKQARKMLAQGKGHRAIANALGLKEEHVKWIDEHPTGTCYWGNKLQGTIRKKHATADHIMKLKAAGMTHSEIARLLKISRMTLLARIKSVQGKPKPVAHETSATG